MRTSAARILFVFVEVLTGVLLAARPADAQFLDKGTSSVTAPARTLSSSPEYDKAYRTAEALYNDVKPMAYSSYPWNAKKPFLWVGFKEKEMGIYTLDLDQFQGQLDEDGRNPVIRNNPEKLAALNQIQDRLSKDDLTSLNFLVSSVDLGGFFMSNHKPEMAHLWIPWTPPENNSVLDGKKMENVHTFIINIIRCLSESKNYHVQFSTSSKFSNIVPLAADGTPLTKQEAAIFWQFDNNVPVSQAIERLYDSLHRAQIVAAKQGLLGESPQ